MKIKINESIWIKNREVRCFGISDHGPPSVLSGLGVALASDNIKLAASYRGDSKISILYVEPQNALIESNNAAC